MRLLGHELYKVFGRKMVWIGLLLAVLLAGFSSLNQVSQLKRTWGDIRVYYHDFFQGNEGPVDASLRQKADEWFTQNRNSYDSKYAQGRASVEENRASDFYGQVIQSQNMIAQRTEEIAKLQSAARTAGGGYASRADALQASMRKALKTPGLYFTMPLENDTIFSYGLGFCLMGVLILLGISPVFSEEYASRMDTLILSARKGRNPVVTAKIVASAVYCAFVAVMVLATNFLCQAFSMGIHGWDAPLQAISEFAQSPYALTVGGYLLAQAGIDIIGCIFFGMLVLLVSSLSPNLLVPFFLCGSLFAVTAFIESTFASVAPAAVKAFGDFSYTELIRVKGLMDAFRTYSVFGHPFLYSDLLLFVYAVITAAVLFLTYRLFGKHQVCG